MGELFNITHDAGNLDEYDSTVIDGGDLSAHADAKLAGTRYGLKCVIDDTTDIYGVVTQAWPGSNEIRYRVYFNTHDYVADNNDVCTLVCGNWCGAAYFNRLVIQWKTGGIIRGLLYATDDAGQALHIVDSISAGEHYAEVHVERASTDVSSDGRVRWWLDGVLQQTWDNVDNYDHCAALSELNLGARYISAGTSGTIYLDEFKANDDGSEIGEVTAVVDGIRVMAMGMQVVKGRE